MKPSARRPDHLSPIRRGGPCRSLPLFLLLSLFLLGACAGLRPVRDADGLSGSAGQAGGSRSSDAVIHGLPPKTNALQLREGDLLTIDLQGIPDPLSTQQQINEQGLISLRYLGELEAKGLTGAELSRKIRETYLEEEIYKEVDVSVSVTDRFVYVGGQVNRPGRVVWTPDLTLSKAIQAAGGYNTFADRRGGVRLTRDDSIYAIDGVVAEERPSMDPDLVPGDSINVSRGMF